IHTDPEALVEVDSLSDFSVNLTTRMWVDTSDYSAVKWALTKAVKLQFDAQNIAIPFPTVTQYNHQR
ncbi:MAG: mechanosensitive ion channel family protein, partial [Parvularculaceae bacterium]